MTVKKQVSLHGKRAFVTKDDQIAGRNGFVAGGEEKPSIVYPSPDTVAIFDDFAVGLNQALDTGVPIGNANVFRQVTGDTGAGSLPVAGANGIFRLYNTQSVAPTFTGAGGKGISGALQWKADMGPGANQGRLRFAARVKVFPDGGGSAVSRTTNRIHAYIGFTDIATYEFPAYDTGAGFISNATDHVGFYLGAGADTGWSAVSVKAGGAAQKVSLTGTTSANGNTVNAPVVNVYDVLEMELVRGPGNTNGTATFFVNGVPKGTIDAPITNTVALAPCVYAFTQDTGSQAIDIDWIAVSGPRDTGQ